MRMLLLVFLAALMLSGCDGGSAQVAPAMSLERQLATLDRTDGGVPALDDAAVKSIKSSLDALAAKFPETTPHDIADQSQRAQQVLAKRGIRVSIAAIMDGLNRATTKHVDGLTFKDALTIYLVSITEKG